MHLLKEISSIFFCFQNQNIDYITLYFIINQTVVPINRTYNETIANMQIIIPHAIATIIEPNLANVEYIFDRSELKFFILVSDICKVKIDTRIDANTATRAIPIESIVKNFRKACAIIESPEKTAPSIN